MDIYIWKRADVKLKLVLFTKNENVQRRKEHSFHLAESHKKKEWEPRLRVSFTQMKVKESIC